MDRGAFHTSAPLTAARRDALHDDEDDARAEEELRGQQVPAMRACLFVPEKMFLLHKNVFSFTEY